MFHKLKLGLLKNKYTVFLIIILIIEICFLIPKVNDNLNFSNKFSTKNPKPINIFRYPILKYPINSTFKNFSGIKLSFGTYMRKNREILEFNLYDDQNKKIYSTQINSENLEDNGEYTIKFNSIKESKNKKYFFDLRSLNGNDLNSVAIYTDNQENIIYDLGYSSLKTKIFFIFLITIVFSTNLLFIWYLYKNKNIKKEKVYLMFCIFYGILMLFIIPPFQIPDEHTHFYNTYKFSKGIYTNPAKLPSSIVDFVDKTRFFEISKNYNNKFNLSDLKTISELNISKYEKLREIKIGTTVAMYNPIVYFPQMIGILIAFFCKLSVLHIFYIGRLFNFLICSLITYFGIKKSPKEIKNIFLIVGLLPLVIQENVSFSVDGLINAFSFLFVAYIFRLYLKEEEIFNLKYGLIFFLGIFIPSIAKIPYFLSILLVMGLPSEKFKSRKQYIFIIFIIMMSTISVYKFWSILGPENPARNMDFQINYIKLNMLKYIETLYLTTRDFLSNYILDSIGLLGIFYMLPNILIYGYLIFIIFQVFSLEKIVKNFKFKSFIFLYLIGTYIILLTALYVAWTALGSKYVDGIQGRYFIPLIPVIIMFFSKKIIIIKKEKLELYTNLFLNFGLAYTLLLLLSRYYI